MVIDTLNPFAEELEGKQATVEIEAFLLSFLAIGGRDAGVLDLKEEHCKLDLVRSDVF